jgi:hypothetical protein
MHRGLWTTSGFEHIPDSNYKLPFFSPEIEERIYTLLPTERLLTLDYVRSIVLKEAWDKAWLATSFDVDRWCIKIASSTRPSIVLWKQAIRTIDEIWYNGISFGSLTIRRK